MKIKTIFGLTLAAVSLASCSVEEQEDSAAKVKEDYTREFVKEFGSFNPNQDWNAMEQKSVTVNTSSPTDVLIYEKQGEEYKLAADYKGVSGSKTITFDGMEGDDTPFIVSLDGNMVPASNGETVEYNGKQVAGAKRSSQIPDDTSWITRSSVATQITLNKKDKVFANLVTDGKDHVDGDDGAIVDELGSYVDVLTAGQGKTFYPMYWNSPNVHEVGLYYYDSNSSDRILVPMFKDHEAGDILYCPGKNNTDEFYPNEANQEESTHFSNTETKGGKHEWTSGSFENYTFKSYGYTVKPTKSIICGVYVKMENGNVYYSDSKLNGGKNYFANRTVTNGNTYTYLCFDDPSDNGGEGDKDYNDLIFYTPSKLTPVVRKDISCLVACEDLGGTFDYDFNDIVFRVYHVAGNDYLTIVPVAAGGTLKATLLYNGKEVSDEWHSHFGDGHEYTDMINTGRITENKIYPIRLNGVPTDFSMTEFTADPNADNGKFSIRVERADGTKVTVTGPSKGEAPQMLVLPFDWKWPTELTNILTTYPDFGEWGANYTNSDWVKTIKDDTYINMGEDVFTATKLKTVDVTK